MPIGTVKFFNDTRGFGFIKPDEGGDDAFVHVTEVEKAGLRNLKEGQRIIYELEQDRRGKMTACKLMPADDVAPVSGSAAE